MAFKLFWQESKPGMDVAGGSGEDHRDVLKTLIETFGRDARHPLSPVDLEKPHVFTLRQMGAGNLGSIYNRIADLVEAHGKIRVWGHD